MFHVHILLQIFFCLIFLHWRIIGSWFSGFFKKAIFFFGEKANLFLCLKTITRFLIWVFSKLVLISVLASLKRENLKSKFFARHTETHLDFCSKPNDHRQKRQDHFHPKKKSIRNCYLFFFFYFLHLFADSFFRHCWILYNHLSNNQRFVGFRFISIFNQLKIQKKKNCKSNIIKKNRCSFRKE